MLYTLCDYHYYYNTTTMIWNMDDAHVVQVPLESLYSVHLFSFSARMMTMTLLPRAKISIHAAIIHASCMSP